MKTAIKNKISKLLKNRIQITVIFLTVIILSSGMIIELQAQGNVSWQGHMQAPASLPALSPMPALVFSPVFFCEELPSSGTLAESRKSLNLLGFLDATERPTLGAGGTEGGADPQKMPVGEGMFVMALLTLAYGIVRRIRS